MSKVRIYGKTVNTWKAWETINWHGQEREIETIQQWEIEYKEYDEQGNLVGCGTEDFSKERHMEIDTKWLWVWDGKSYNKGGHRKFECIGTVKFNLNNQREVLGYLRNKYSDQKLVQLRTF